MFNMWHGTLALYQEMGDICQIMLPLSDVGGLGGGGGVL